MAYLGVNYQLAYEAKKFRTGLTDIIAMIVKPNGVVVGPVSLTEFLAMGFTGLYGYSFATTLADPEGEYFASIISPTEGVRDFHRFTLDLRPPASGTTIQSAGTVIGYVNAGNEVEAELSPDSSLNGVIEANQVVEAETQPTAEIENTLPENETTIGDLSQ